MAGMIPSFLGAALERCLWEGKRNGRRLARRVGWAGIALIVASAALVPAWLQWERAAARLAVARRALQALPSSEPRAVVGDAASGDGRERLRRFDAYLLPHEDIPDTLQDLFRLANAENLTLQRGEYKVEPDQHGGFVRYRMILPVKGDAQAIYRFVQAALIAHQTLALDSVQFRRERIDAKHVEARIQWILLTRLPGAQKPVGTEGKT